jgi:DNA polymerase-3 subunit delta'
MSSVLSDSEAPAAPAFIGNPVAAAILARALRSGRVAHAYLFHGPKGVGKSSAARLFTRVIQCAVLRPRFGDPGHPGLHPCGRCDDCRRVAAGTHPDVLEVLPDTATGQNISVRQAGAVVANVALRPKTGLRRVFLFPNAELLHEDAANALLKTLEEPGEFVTLILCAPDLEQVLPTIRSRCQPVRFDPVPAATLAAGLVRRGVEPETARSLALAAGGRPGAAIAALADPGFTGRRQQALSIFDQALAARPRCAASPAEVVAGLRLAESLRAAAEDERDAKPGGDAAAEAARPLKSHLAAILEVGQDYVRDILVLGEGGPPTALYHPDRLPLLEEHCRTLDRAAALELIRLLAETALLLDRNVAPQLALERLFLRFLTS